MTNTMSHIYKKHIHCTGQYEKYVDQGKNSRCKREFVQEEMKDGSYWEKRRKNNLAAKKSREKKRLQDIAMENRIMALNLENSYLKSELLFIKTHFGIIGSSENIRQTHTNSKVTSCYSPRDQVRGIKAINWGDYTSAEHSVVSKATLKYLVEDEKRLSDSLSKQEPLNIWEHSNKLLSTATTSNNKVINSIHIANSPDLLNHSNRLNQEIPVILPFPVYSSLEKVSEGPKVAALPHKLRIKTKTVVAAGL